MPIFSGQRRSQLIFFYLEIEWHVVCFAVYCLMDYKRVGECGRRQAHRQQALVQDGRAQALQHGRLHGAVHGRVCSRHAAQQPAHSCRCPSSHRSLLQV